MVWLWGSSYSAFDGPSFMDFRPLSGPSFLGWMLENSLIRTVRTHGAFIGLPILLEKRENYKERRNTNAKMTKERKDWEVVIKWMTSLGIRGHRQWTAPCGTCCSEAWRWWARFHWSHGWLPLMLVDSGPLSFILLLFYSLGPSEWDWMEKNELTLAILWLRLFSLFDVCPEFSFVILCLVIIVCLFQCGTQIIIVTHFIKPRVYFVLSYPSPVIRNCNFLKILEPLIAPN